MVKTIEEIEKVLTKKPPDQLIKFRTWYEKFDSEILKRNRCNTLP